MTDNAEKKQLSATAQLFIAQAERDALRTIAHSLAAGLEMAEAELKQAQTTIEMLERPVPADSEAEEAREAIRTRNARVADYIAEFLASGARNEAAVSRMIYDMSRALGKEE